MEVRVEAVREDLLGEYAALSAAEYGAEAAVASADHLRWKLLQNPQGESVAIHAFHGGRLVGRLVAMPRAFEGGGRTFRGGYMVDLLLHPEHRGIAALAAVASGVRKLPFDLLLATPNQSGIPVWRQLLRFPEPFELDLLAVPLQPARLAARAKGWSLGTASRLLDSPARWALSAAGAMAGAAGGLERSEGAPEGAELEALVSRALPAGVLHGQRDDAFLRWRFGQGPRFRYQGASFRRRGELVAYAFTRRVQHLGFDAVLVADLVADPALGPSERQALAWGLAREAAGAGAELLLFLGNARPEAARPVDALPFLRVPRALAPQATPLFAEWLAPGGPELGPRDLFLTLADCDMF